jgi:hypothetical protein
MKNCTSIADIQPFEKKESRLVPLIIALTYECSHIVRIHYFPLESFHLPFSTTTGT